MSTAVEVIDRTLILCLNGPIIPSCVANAFVKALPLITGLDVNGKPWGSIIIVENDASWFPEAMNLLVSNLKLPIFKRRVCMALVALHETKGSAEMTHSFIELYGSKINADLMMFNNMMDASKWVDQRLIEADT